MLGLQKEDLSRAESNELPWKGYQVSMRILEVTMCTLLAVIATTPLRSSPIDDAGGNQDVPTTKVQKFLRRCCCCFIDSNPPREFEDEIYSEICSNNQSVRQMMMVQQNGMIGQGTIMRENPYGTLGGRIVMNQQMMPMGTLRHSGGELHMDPTQDPTVMFVQGVNGIEMQRNSATVNSIASSSSNPNSTLRSGVPKGDVNRASVASSRVTIDTGLYSNIRSRPSSMLFNDSGFVRFRMGDDPGVGPEEVLKQSTHDLTKDSDGPMVKESHSFDQGALIPRDDQPSPIYKSIEDSSENGRNKDDELSEGIYEAPPGMKYPPPRKASKGIYSESDLESVEPTYNGSSKIYSSRAESRCSSISATQSFDMRMYGKTKPGVSMTMKKNEETKEKLENPFYYYGSTRNQKKFKQQQLQKPRPLLPSQRQQLELMQKKAPVNASSRPSSRQALLDQHQKGQQQSKEQMIPFQRSRSLGGYYNRQPQEPVPPPVRNQQQFFQVQPAGSMTPMSYSRWQHAQVQEQGPKRYNPLYDTPPTVRHAQMSNNNPMQMLRMEQQPIRMGYLEEGGGGLQPQFQQFYPEIRGVLGTPNNTRRQPPHLPTQQSVPVMGAGRRRMVDQQLLSPILTDHETSPLNRRPGKRHESSGFYLSDDDDAAAYADEEDSDVASTFDQFTSQATQGYSEGLADNESEVSSISELKKGPSNKDRQMHLVSPLEYSAMLKLYSQDAPSSNGATVRNLSQSKDVTPDSGVVMENNSDSNKSRGARARDDAAVNRTKKSQIPVRQESADAPRSGKKAKSSLLNSSSSLNDLLGMNNKSAKEAASRQRHQDYSRVGANDNHDTSVFSSSPSSASSSEESSDEGGGGARLFQGSAPVPAERRYHPLVSPQNEEKRFPGYKLQSHKKPRQEESFNDEDDEKEDLEAIKNRAADKELVKACREIQAFNKRSTSLASKQ